MPRPKKYKIILSDKECQELKNIVRNKKTSRTVKCRCQIILDLDEAHGKVLTHEQCSKSNGISLSTVQNTVKLYTTDGLDGVCTLKRNVNSDNARRKLDGRAEARLIEIACGTVPEGNTRWTLRLLEKQAKIILDTPVSKDTIGRALKKTNCGLTKTTTGASRRKKTPNS